MCGIFAYLNFFTPKDRKEIIAILLQGLRRMEYRGYDSAGLAIDSGVCGQTDAGVNLYRKCGKVNNLEDAINADTTLDLSQRFNTHCGIAHTRWATHGSPNDVNSHPQRSSGAHEFVVVHNGIITNYKEIKEYLRKKGYDFESETDTEVIAKLIHHIHETNPDLKFHELVETTTQQLEGAFALAFKSRRFPGQVVGTRRGSPLVVGIKCADSLRDEHFPVYLSKAAGWVWQDDKKLRRPSGAAEAAPPNGSAEISDKKPNGVAEPPDGPMVEYFLASDASAIVEHTKQVIFLEDDDVALVSEGRLTIHRIRRDAKDNSVQRRAVQQLNLELHEIMRGDFKTFMQKEIFEQPESVVNTMRGRVLPDGRVLLGGIQDFLPEIKRCRRLILIACGTSYNSAIACRQLMEELSELPVVLELASDFLDRETPIFRDDVCIFISQSGETADTLNALRYCKPRGALLIGITNTVGSSICRETHCGIHINAGPEIGVASTKAYTSQILALVMFALSLGDDRISMQARRCEIVAGLQALPAHVRRILRLDGQVREVARHMFREKSVLVMGRGYHFATCLEGALKIKELSYMHCEGIMSGELKHGPLAMVDEQLCIVMVICKDNVFKKSINALQQVLARGGRPIIIADEAVPAEELQGARVLIRVPTTVDCIQNILTVIPLQLLSYHVAELNGLNVDRPRNLAKSVTVE